jgi:hypothetical protein
MSSGEASQFSMYPQDPQTWSKGLTAAKMFHRLTLIRLPAPPASRFPGTRMMSLDRHLGQRFVFFIDNPPSYLHLPDMEQPASSRNSTLEAVRKDHK